MEEGSGVSPAWLKSLRGAAGCPRGSAIHGPPTVYHSVRFGIATDQWECVSDGPGWTIAATDEQQLPLGTT